MEGCYDDIHITILIKYNMDAFFNHLCSLIVYSIGFALKGVSNKDTFVTSHIKLSKVLLTIVVNETLASKGSKI